MAIRPTPLPLAPVGARTRPAAWRFWAAMALQLLLVLSVPAAKVGAYTAGTTITLAIAPVDPYDLLRGRYMALDYPLEHPETLRGLPGWQEAYARGRHDLYLTLRPGPAGGPWQAVAVGAERPTPLAPGRAVIRGRMADGSLQLGLREYYLPEAVGDAAEAGLRRAPASARAELKVDDHGSAVLTGLWIEGRRY